MACKYRSVGANINVVDDEGLKNNFKRKKYPWFSRAISISALPRGSTNDHRPHLKNCSYTGLRVSSWYVYPSAFKNSWNSAPSSGGTCETEQITQCITRTRRGEKKKTLKKAYEDNKKKMTKKNMKKIRQTEKNIYLFDRRIGKQLSSQQEPLIKVYIQPIMDTIVDMICLPWFYGYCCRYFLVVLSTEWPLITTHDYKPQARRPPLLVSADGLTEAYSLQQQCHGATART